MSFLMRTVMYVLIVFGVGWLLLPIDDVVREAEYQDVIRFERAGTTAELQASFDSANELSVLDGATAAEVGLGELNSGRHELLDGWGMTVSAESWRRVQELVGSQTDELKLVFNERILTLQVDSTVHPSIEGVTTNEPPTMRIDIDVGPPLLNPKALVRVDDEDVERSPGLSAALAAAVSGGPADWVAETVWAQEADVLGETAQNGFRYDNVVIVPRYDVVEEEQLRTVPVLPIRVAGGALILLAIVIAHRLYRTRRGPWLNVSNFKGAAIADVLTVLVGAVLCAGAPAAVAALVLDVRNPLAELGSVEAAVFAGVFGLVIGAPIMSLFASSFAPSWVTVDAEGIRQQGMILRSHVRWDEIDSITVEERVVRGRDRWGNPTESGSIHLKVLELESEDGVITLLPPSRRVRRELVERLREHVPDWQRDRLEEHLAAWP